MPHFDAATSWLEGIITMRMQTAKAQGKTLRRPRAAARPMLYPHQIEREYVRFIQRILEKIAAAGEPYIVEADRRQDDEAPDSWAQSMRDMYAAQRKILEENGGNALVMIKGFGDEADKWNRKEWSKQLKPFTTAEMYPPGDGVSKAAVDAWAQENLARIKTLSDQQIQAMNKVVRDAVGKGLNMRDIRKIVEGEKLKYTGWRAELLARDQTGKLNGALTQARSSAAGVTKYIWRGVLDQRERPEHRHLEGAVRPWNGGGIIPGEEILCRCTSEPELDDIWTKCEQDVYGKQVTEEVVKPSKVAPKVGTRGTKVLPKKTAEEIAAEKSAKVAEKARTLGKKFADLEQEQEAILPKVKKLEAERATLTARGPWERIPQIDEELKALRTRRWELTGEIEKARKAWDVAAKAAREAGTWEFNPEGAAGRWHARSWSPDIDEDWRKALAKADAGMMRSVAKDASDLEANGAYYRNTARKVAQWGPKFEVDDANARATWRHEFGHRLDNQLSGRLGDMWSATELTGPMARDAAGWIGEVAYDRNAISWTTRLEKVGMSRSEFKEFWAKFTGVDDWSAIEPSAAALLDGSPETFLARMRTLKFRYNTPSMGAYGLREEDFLADVFGAASRGKVGHGHSAAYYAKDHLGPSEIVANVTHLMGGPHAKAWAKILPEILPKTFSALNSAVKTYAGSP